MPLRSHRVRCANTGLRTALIARGTALFITSMLSGPRGMPYSLVRRLCACNVIYMKLSMCKQNNFANIKDFYPLTSILHRVIIKIISP